MYNVQPNSVGAFKIDNGHWFTYCRCDDMWASEYGYFHKIDVGTDTRHPEYRYANVLKTRVHVVVDEDSIGEPVIETWIIVKHERFDQTSG